MKGEAIFQTTSEADTMAFAAALSPMLHPGDTVLLRGDLGAGKSVLARGIARGMGVRGAMPSPTFTLMIPYEGAAGRLYHFDLYRLGDAEEYYAAGLDEFVGGDGVAVVEWPEMADLLPERALEVTLRRVPEDENARRITVKDMGVAGFSPEALEKWSIDA